MYKLYDYIINLTNVYSNILVFGIASLALFILFLFYWSVVVLIWYPTKSKESGQLKDLKGQSKIRTLFIQCIALVTSFFSFVFGFISRTIKALFKYWLILALAIILAVVADDLHKSMPLVLQIISDTYNAIIGALYIVVTPILLSFNLVFTTVVPVWNLVFQIGGDTSTAAAYTLVNCTAKASQYFPVLTNGTSGVLTKTAYFISSNKTVALWDVEDELHDLSLFVHGFATTIINCVCNKTAVTSVSTFIFKPFKEKHLSRTVYSFLNFFPAVYFSVKSVITEALGQHVTYDKVRNTYYFYSLTLT